MTDKKIHPNLDFPVVRGYESKELPGSTSVELVGEDFSDDNIKIVYENILLPPQNVNFVRETINVSPDGKATATVFIEVPDDADYDEIEVRLS